MVLGRLRGWLQGLERVSLGVRLTVLVAVPLLVIALVSSLAVTSRWGAAAENAGFSAGLDDVKLIQEAVRALQQERALTVRLRMEGGGAGEAAVRAELELARSATDQMVTATGLSTTIPDDPVGDARPPRNEPGGGADARGQRPPEQSGAPARGGAAALGQRPEPETLAELRAQLDESNGLFWITLPGYTLLVQEFQAQVVEAARIEPGELSSPVIANMHLNVAVESLAQMRDLGVGYLDEPPLVEAAMLAQLSDTERTYLSLAAQTGAPYQLELLTPLTVLGSEAMGGDLRSAILSSGPRPNPGLTPPADRPALSGREWLGLSASRLAVMVQASDYFLEHLTSDAEAATATAYRQLALILGLTVLVLLAVAFGAWAVSRSISRPLHRLALTAQLAAVGNLTAVDVPPSRDAIGEIGAAIDELRARSDGIASAAEEIAGGDLSRVIEPRSGGDRLGWALRTMTQRLASMVAQSEQRSEQLAGEVGSLQESASTDMLTGLANRRKFSALLESGIVNALAESQQLGLLFIDLDGFKRVNDTMGHDVGDELLRCVSDRLTAAVGAGDAVGRFGGDEFTVMVSPSADHDDGHVQATARRVVEALTMPYDVGGRTVQLGASLGAAQFPEHGDSAEQLLRTSDQAMYEAKQAGGGIRVARASQAAA